MSVKITPDQVSEAFLAATPLIAQEILDLSIKHPNWMGSLYELAEWPLGEGALMEQIIFRGARPQIERGFAKWRKVNNLQGCNPCEPPDCAYNWSTFGGHALERKVTELMHRDFRSPDYCVNEIQTSAHFKQVFAKVVEGLYAQIDFFKEMNIGQNYITELAKKCVVDSQGAKFNPTNPYVYRNTGGVKLSTLNIEMLEFFYEQLRRMPDTIPYDVVDGSPVYSLMASHQLLARLYRDDANLRQDVRFSGMANDLLMKYNFMSTIRGQFIAAPILYPRRFNILLTGEPEEVLPFVNDVPGEFGTYTYLNPGYEQATHEEVIIHGRSPFKVWYMPSAQTLGEGTSFGPSFGFMENWAWINPLTETDPFRRQGFFATEATIGLNPQFSEGIFGILAERPSSSLMAMYTPNPVCPVPAPVCTNVVPTVSCPCPVVMSISANPFNANRYYFTFATAVAGAILSPVVLEYDNGGTVTGILQQLSADGLTAELDFSAVGGLPSGACSTIVSVNCNSSALLCSATVEFASDCGSATSNTFTAVLSNPLKAQTAGQVLVGFFGDCTQVNVETVSVDTATLTWTLRYVGGVPVVDDVLCKTGGLSKLCVPPATDATCPACVASSVACVGPLP